MHARRLVLPLLLAAASVLPACPARAEAPAPGERERAWALAAALAAFEAGRFEQAVVHFEAAAMVVDGPLPAEAVSRWGIAAAESGWPFAAYIRLRQALESTDGMADHQGLERRLTRARDILLSTAAHQSRIVVFQETRPDSETRADRHVVRLVGRSGAATVEALSGARVVSPTWERAGEVSMATYLELVGRLLDAGAMIDDLPRQELDLNLPGSRRAVSVRLVIGDEERLQQALRGESYERLRELADVVLEFARAALIREGRR